METLILGILSLAGTLVGTVAGILSANKLTLYRIGQLEEKVDRISGIIEEQINIQNRLDNIEDKQVDFDKRLERIESK